MGNHIRIVYDPTLYFIQINCNTNFIRLSELAHTAWRGDGHYISIVFSPTKLYVKENVCLVKRDWRSTLKTKSIRTSLQRLEIGIQSISAHEFCVYWKGLKKLERSLIVSARYSEFQLNQNLSCNWKHWWMHI